MTLYIHRDENRMYGSQMREIGGESRQEVIKRLDGSLHLETKQHVARAINVKRCGENGNNESKDAQDPEPRRAARFPLQAWSLGAKKATAHIRMRSEEKATVW